MIEPYIPYLEPAYQDAFEKVIYNHLFNDIEFSSLSDLLRETILVSQVKSLPLNNEIKRLFFKLRSTDRLNTDNPSVYITYLDLIIQFNNNEKTTSTTRFIEEKFPNYNHKTHTLIDSKGLYESMLKNRSSLFWGTMITEACLKIILIVGITLGIPALFRRAREKINSKLSLCNNIKQDKSVNYAIITMLCFAIFILSTNGLGNCICCTLAFFILALISCTIFILNINYLDFVNLFSIRKTETHCEIIMKFECFFMILGVFFLPYSHIFSGILILFGNLYISVALLKLIRKPILNFKKSIQQLKDLFALSRTIKI